MGFKFNFLVVSATFSLAACGGSGLNAKNADTFQASMTKMLKNLSEQDRRKVGTGIMLSVDHANTEDITLNNIFSAQGDAEYLVASGDDDNFLNNRSQLLGQMIIKSDGRLSGKSAKDFMNHYAQSIDAASDKDIETSNKLLSELDTEAAGIATSLENYAKKKSNLEAKDKKLRKEGEAYLENFEFTKFSMSKHRSGISAKNIVSFTVNNPSEVAISYPTIGIEFRLKDDPKLLHSGWYRHYSRKSIAPGAQRIFDNLRINQAFSIADKDIEIPTTIDGYDITAYLAKVKLPDRTYKLFSIKGDEWNFVHKKGYENRVNGCSKAQTQLDTFRDKVQARIDKLKKREIDDLGRVNRYGNFNC